MNEKQRFVIDTTKISKSEKAQDFKKDTIKEVLENLEQKKQFAVGDLVTTLEGPHAHVGLMVIELEDNGMVRIAPAPNMPTIEIDESRLFHFDDYHEAFKVALVEEQIYNPDQPQ